MLYDNVEHVGWSHLYQQNIQITYFGLLKVGILLKLVQIISLLAFYLSFINQKLVNFEFVQMACVLKTLIMLW